MSAVLSGSGSGIPADAGRTAPAGFVVRPDALFIVFFPLRQYAGILLFTAFAWLATMAWAWSGVGVPIAGARVMVAGGVVLGVRLVWAVLQWATRAYGLDGGGTAPGGVGRLWSSFGVLDRRTNEIGLRGLRSISVDRPFLQRLCGVGSIGFASAGTEGFEVVWVIVRDPEGLVDRVRRAGGRDG